MDKKTVSAKNTATKTNKTAANKLGNKVAELQRSISLLATSGEELPSAVRRWHEARVARLQRAVYRPRRK